MPQKEIPLTVLANCVILNNAAVDDWERGNDIVAVQSLRRCIADLGMESFATVYLTPGSKRSCSSKATNSSEAIQRSNHSFVSNFYVFCNPRRFNPNFLTGEWSLSLDPHASRHMALVIATSVLLNLAIVMQCTGMKLGDEAWLRQAKPIYESCIALLTNISGPDSAFLTVCALNNLAALHRHYFEFQERNLYLQLLTFAIKEHVSLLFVLLSQVEYKNLVLNLVLGWDIPSTACAA